MILNFIKEWLSKYAVMNYLPQAKNGFMDFLVIIETPKSHESERLLKLMGMLVIDGNLFDVENEIRMKIIILKKA